MAHPLEVLIKQVVDNLKDKPDADPGLKSSVKALAEKVKDAKGITDEKEKTHVLYDLSRLRTKLGARMNRLALVKDLNANQIELQKELQNLRDELDSEMIPSEGASNLGVPGEFVSGLWNGAGGVLRKNPWIWSTIKWIGGAYAAFKFLVKPLIEKAKHPVDTGWSLLKTAAGIGGLALMLPKSWWQSMRSTLGDVISGDTKTDEKKKEDEPSAEILKGVKEAIKAMQGKGNVFNAVTATEYVVGKHKLNVGNKKILVNGKTMSISLGPTVPLEIKGLEKKGDAVKLTAANPLDPTNPAQDVSDEITADDLAKTIALLGEGKESKQNTKIAGVTVTLTIKVS